jgi:hypothetical protein
MSVLGKGGEIKGFITVGQFLEAMNIQLYEKA